MKKRNVLTLASIVAILLAPAAFGAEPNSVAGEKLDSGLGGLSPSYAATEFQRSAVPAGYRVRGEKLDSGLGDLPSDYTAAEFRLTGIQVQTTDYHVVGEKLDSGLGKLTRHN